MIGFFKRFLRKASGEALLSRMEQPSSVDDTYKLSAAYLSAHAATPALKARMRIVKREREIERLRKNKKRFSHLIAEQKADYKIAWHAEKEAFAECVGVTSASDAVGMKPKANESK